MGVERRYRYRLTFCKTGKAVYFGHLDLLRVFQRAIRRAGLPARYSEGFNPHMLISFAQPLAVGVEGRAEICDIELVADISGEEVSSALNAALPEGIRVTGCDALETAAKSAAALVRWAVYDMRVAIVNGDGDGGCTLDLSGAAERIISADSTFEKRELIRGISASGLEVCAVLACGGQANLKPDVVAAELCRMTGVAYDHIETSICRRGLMF